MNASTPKDALKLVEELEDDLPVDGAPESEAPPMDDGAEGAELPPSEPPINDEAVGADTEGNVALQLLADIKNLLMQLVTGESPEGELEDEVADEDAAESESEAEGDAADAVPEPAMDDEQDLNPVGQS